jgi:peptidoglycan hydrolase CwlO-like protein
MIDPLRSTVELKTTLNQFFKTKKKIKRVLTPIKARDYSPNKTQNKFSEIQNEPTQYCSILKNDIDAINEYIKVYKDILLNCKYENSILHNETFKNRIEKIDSTKNSENILNNHKEPLTKLNNENNGLTKDDLIRNLSIENNLMKLYLQKLNNLFFLVDSKYFETFSSEYKDSISRFDNIKYCLDKLPLIDKLGNEKKKFQISSIQRESIDSFDLGEIGELNAEIKSMNKFEEFLDWNLSDNPFSQSLEKIKELFYKFNEEILGLFVTFITEKLKVNSPLLKKTKMALSNNISDIEEYASLIRKVMEDKFDELQKQIQVLNKDNGDLKVSLDNANENIKLYQSKIDDFNNRDYKTYFERMKEENNKFFEDIKKIERERCSDLYEKLRDRQEKLDNVKKEIKKYKNEIEALKQQIEFHSRIPYQKKDEYYNALIKNFDDMINGFNEKFDDLSEQYYNNKMVLKKKISLLEDENKTAKALQNLLEKRLKDIDRMFSK